MSISINKSHLLHQNSLTGMILITLFALYSRGSQPLQQTPKVLPQHSRLHSYADYVELKKSTSNANLRKPDFLSEEKISDRSRFVNKDVSHYPALVAWFAMAMVFHSVNSNLSVNMDKIPLGATYLNRTYA